MRGAKPTGSHKLRLLPCLSCMYCATLFGFGPERHMMVLSPSRKQPPLIQRTVTARRMVLKGRLPCISSPNPMPSKADMHVFTIPSCPSHTRRGAEGYRSCQVRRRSFCLVPSPHHHTTTFRSTVVTMRERPRQQRTWLLFLLLLSLIFHTTHARPHDVSRRRPPLSSLWLYRNVSRIVVAHHLTLQAYEVHAAGPRGLACTWHHHQGGRVVCVSIFKLSA
jgi:hypothetical protein